MIGTEPLAVASGSILSEAHFHCLVITRCYRERFRTEFASSIDQTQLPFDGHSAE